MARKQRWTYRPEILSYIIDSYAGTETTSQSGKTRRVFIWEDGAEIKMGNSEAFLNHLCAKFELILSMGATGSLHELLRELGECVQTHKQHAARRLDSPATGKFVQPEPDEWVIGMAKKEESTIGDLHEGCITNGRWKMDQRNPLIDICDGCGEARDLTQRRDK